MIGIRSITYQFPASLSKTVLDKVVKLSFQWNQSYSFIRTQRIALTPLNEKTDLKAFKEVNRLCNLTDIRWFDVPLDPQNSNTPQDLIQFGYHVLSEYKSSFVNVIAVKNNIVDISILGYSAELLRKVSIMRSNGKENFRLGVSMNISPNGPFFPFTYSSGELGFSIALELTQEINSICLKNREINMVALRQIILDQLVPQIKNIEIIAENIAEMYGVKFYGFDFSLAPIIETNGSVISILNTLGVYDFGKAGSMFATGFITNILKHLAHIFKSVGFSGVMYSLLEDLELCSINIERGVSLEQLISLSTMCGCGVDMVPIYGKVRNDEIVSIFLDIASISMRLNKPLGVRILPIPNCKKGSVQFTEFDDDADFVANTKVVQPDLNLLSDLGEQLNYLDV